MNLLDKVKSGWREKINVEKLVMYSSINCILGQLYSNYNIGVKELFNITGGLGQGEAVQHGFLHDANDEYEDIKNEWLKHLNSGQH